MKRLKILILTFLFLALSVSAQQAFDYRNPDFSKPQKVDEFGALQNSDLMARLDGAAIFLQSYPNLKIFILGFRSKDDAAGKTKRLFRLMKNYLTRSRGIDPQRVILTEQGESDFGFGFQIWIASEGQTPELKYPVTNYLEDTSVARKFDEYYYAFNDLEYDYWDGDNLDEYVALIKKEPNAIAYVILYPEYSSYGNENGKTITRRDSVRKTNLVKANIIKDLTKKHKLSLSRIRLINGGYRDYRQIELWILPKGVVPPAATLDAFPKTK